MPRTAAILVAMSLVTPLPLFAARESNLGPTISAVRPADAPPPRIPETPAGRLLASWLEAHNRGDGSSLETWLRRSFSDTRLANMNVDRALAWYLESTRMFGKLAEKPYHVVEDEPHRLVVWFLDAELEETGHVSPQFLPDGRRLLYLGTRSTSANTGLFVGSLDSIDTKRFITDAVSDAHYPPRGFIRAPGMSPPA